MRANYDMSIHSNPDAKVWAQFFIKTIEENPDIEIDEALMLSWFANAMMAMHDYVQQENAQDEHKLLIKQMIKES